MEELSPILHKTATDIVIEIVKAYENSTGVFTNKVNAEDLVPHTTLENKAQFLFWTIQIDYSTKSSRIYENANKLWKTSPQWIEVDYILSLDESEIEDLIRNKLQPRFSTEIKQRYRENALKLKSLYQSKAINIVKKSASAQDMLNRIKDFRGFGPKLSNYLTRTYIDIFNLSFKDISEIMPPIDRHDVRLTYEWGFLPTKEMSVKNIDYTKNLWSNACKEAKISWIKFDKALWLIGSEGVRTEKPKQDYTANLDF